MSLASYIPRRKLARYLADVLIQPDDDSRVALQQIAGYLVESGRTKEINLLVRDVEDILAESGLVVVDITSAYGLRDDDISDVKKILKAKQLFIRDEIDRNVLGGLKIETSSQRLDATLKHRIDSLHEMASKERI